MIDLNVDNLKNKVKNYNTVLENTNKYREIWNESLREQIKTDLIDICGEGGLKIELSDSDQFSNLNAIICTLGNVRSGIYETMEPDIEKHLMINLQNDKPLKPIADYGNKIYSKSLRYWDRNTLINGIYI